MSIKSKIGVVILGIILFQYLLSVKTQAIETNVGGVIFADYEFVTSKYLENGTTAQNINSFDVPRVYLNINSKFSEKINSFIQYEVNLISRDNTSNSPYLKQALLEIKDIYKEAKIRFGLIPTLWRSYEESIWKHRFVAKVLDDIEGFSSSTDRGISLNGKISILEYDVGIFNGEGTKTNESNKYKDISTKLAISLFKTNSLKGLKINLFYNNGLIGTNQERNRFIGGFSYESKKINAMANYYYAKTKGVKSNGFSVHSVYNFSDDNWIFARYDNYDPDRDIDNNARSRVFVGFGQKIIDGVKITLDYQSTIQQKQSPTNKNQSIISSHIEVKF